jgi:RNA polymerase sigma-54 factor
MRAALELVQHLDPAGIGALDLRDCLRIQLDAQLHELELVFARIRRMSRMADATGSRVESSCSHAHDFEHGRFQL